jgi:hypothetical protein
MNKLGIAALALILVVGVFAFLLLGNLDSIVKSTVEDVGSELTGTSVTLEGATIDLVKGSATLQGLTIDNPKGYDSDFAFYLKEVTVAIDLASLKNPVIVLNEVMVRGSRLNAEQKGESSNLSDLLANVEANSKKAGAAEQKQPAEESAEVLLALKRFEFANTEAKLITEAQGDKTIKVPDVQRRNIGTVQQGLTPVQLGDQLLQAVLEEVEAAVADYMADLAKEALKDSIREKIGFPSE